MAPFQHTLSTDDMRNGAVWKTWFAPVSKMPAGSGVGCRESLGEDRRLTPRRGSSTIAIGSENAEKPKLFSSLLGRRTEGV